MYGFAPFATLYGETYGDSHLSLGHAFTQLQLIYQHCLHKPTGLIVHGYDASRRAPWADPKTGASPVVWGRSLAWYTIGLLDALEIARSSPDLMHTKEYGHMQTIFHSLVTAEANAIRKSAEETGRYGVWQVLDQPGKEDNWIEASASAMIMYALAKGVRLGFLASSNDVEGSYSLPQKQMQDQEGMLDLALAIYKDILAHFVVQAANGTLDYKGTSIISSLHINNPDYQVRPSYSSPDCKDLTAPVLYEQTCPDEQFNWDQRLCASKLGNRAVLYRSLGRELSDELFCGIGLTLFLC